MYVYMHEKKIYLIYIYNIYVYIYIYIYIYRERERERERERDRYIDSYREGAQEIHSKCTRGISCQSVLP